MSTTTMVIKGKYTILSGGKVAVVVVKRCPPCIYSLDILDIGKDRAMLLLCSLLYNMYVNK